MTAAAAFQSKDEPSRAPSSPAGPCRPAGASVGPESKSREISFKKPQWGFPIFGAPFHSIIHLASNVWRKQGTLLSGDLMRNYHGTFLASPAPPYTLNPKA